MTIKEKLEAIKTLTLCDDNVNECITSLAKHITGELITKIKKEITDISIRVDKIRSLYQIRLPRKHSKKLINHIIKKLNANGYYAEYDVLDVYGDTACVLITASMMHELNSKPDKDKNEALIKAAQKTRIPLVKTAVLEHLEDISESFDYNLRNALARNKTNETITLVEKDVRIINDYIAADIEDYIDIAMTTIKEFCDKNGIIITNLKKWDNNLVWADLTVEI